MNRAAIICGIAALCLLSTSCHKDEAGESMSDRVHLNIRETILTSEIDAVVDSKAAIKGTAFPDESTIGLFICKHTDETPNPYEEHALRYSNIRGTKGSGGTWLYNYSGYSAFPTLFIVKNEDDYGNSITADVFAYAPHLDNITSPSGIPFQIAGQNDMMYAVENSNPTVNKNIDPLSGTDEVDIPLTFTHALSLLEFCFTIKNEKYNHPDGNGSAMNYTLTNINIMKNPDKDAEDIHLYSSASLNAIDGTLHSFAETGSVNLTYSLNSKAVSYTNVSGKRMIKVSVLLIPAQPGDDDYIFRFGFNKIMMTSQFSLKKAHRRHGTSDTYGFLPGHRYTFNFELDNYIHLSDVEFGEWTTEDDPVYEIEI